MGTIAFILVAQRERERERECWERADTRERLRENFSELNFLLLSFLQFSFAENRVFARTKQKGLSTKIEENALMKS